MSFIWPPLLLSLLLLPVLVFVYWGAVQKQQQARAELGPMGLVQSSSGQALGRRRHIPPLFFWLGIACLMLALARPEMVLSLPRVEGTVILAFDVSASMSATDLEPSRIEAAKAAARAFVENQPPTIRLGVVAFSGGGLIVQQPGDDRTALLDTIERLSPQGGTSLGHGIFTALSAIAGEPIVLDEEALDEEVDLRIEDFSSAVILLLTDGENTVGLDPLEIAQLAAEAGVRIYPIGIGSEEGAVLEIDGFNILTQLNEPALQEIASVTNGSYYFAEDAESLREIYESVDLQMTVRGEEMEVTAVAAGLGLLFFLVGAALSLLWLGRVP